MQFPTRFSDLPEYAFPRLRALLDSHAPGGDVLHMSIGEPRHAPPPFAFDIIAEHRDEFTKYPPNEGTVDLRAAISGWIDRRYGATVDPGSQVMAACGSREALFNAALALSPETKNGDRPTVLIPNPFYQCYAVAALTAGAEPVFVPATALTGFLPDFAGLPRDVLDRATVAYICSPSNPQGAVADAGYWSELMGLAERHDFLVFADECYSEIYRDAAPMGALQAGGDPERVFVFNSLSKRSNLPGLRSGFVAGGPRGMAELKKLRAYSGAPLPLPIQHASAAIWADEQHVNENRALYVRKYSVADEVFGDVQGYQPPVAGFFLWLAVNDGEAAALNIWKNSGVRVLPGKYLSREVQGMDPGAGYIRVAMVAEADELRAGLRAIREHM